MLKTYSPLRYPGGKNRLSEFVKVVIKNTNMNNITYVEPFAGGAGVALSLLLDKQVSNIVINDYDKAIYSFWRAVKNEHENLIQRIINTPVTIEEWYRQKEIYEKAQTYSIDLAFATLFLNRTNRSGILTAGPIGGYSQDGEWKLDVRYNKESLISKIYAIAKYKNNIAVYNKDILSLITHYMPKFGQNVFTYFDPPYYIKGQKLYKNFFIPSDHKRIKNAIVNYVHTPWIVTYDDVQDVFDMYSDYPIRKFDLTYSVANKGKASELMIFSSTLLCPTEEQLKNKKININFRQ